MPWPPAIVSSPAPPSSVGEIARRPGRCRDHGGPAETADRELVTTSGWWIATAAAAGHGDARGVSADSDRVLAGGAVDDDRRSAASPVTAQEAGEIDVHASDVGSGQVVDRDEVRPAEGVEVDPLDAGRVHGDVGLGAEEPEPVSVRRQVDLLGDVGAVEAHRVGTGLAFDRVAAVARIPDEGIVAGAQQGPVVASVAVERVVALAAEQGLRSGSPGQGVVCRFPRRSSSGWRR